MICRHTPTHGWECGWLGGSVGQWVGLGQMTNNWIKLDLIDIIQFFEDLWFVDTSPPMGGWLGVWVVGWVSGSMGGVRSNDYHLNKSWPNRDNSILFEDLWFVETPPPMGAWLGVSVGQWVGQVKSLFNKSWHNWDNSILFEDYNLWRHLHLWMGVWVVLWMGGSVGQWVGSGHITKYRINLNLIEIIQFCLKMYDLLRHPHLWVGVWVNGWGQVKWLIL